MTNEIAIEYLKDMLASAEANLHVPDMAEHAEALNMAIEALEVGHAQCNDCHYRYHWMTQRMNGQNGGATA